MNVRKESETKDGQLDRLQRYQFSQSIKNPNYKDKRSKKILLTYVIIERIFQKAVTPILLNSTQPTNYFQAIISE